jgi:hypothetical protein
LTKPENLIVPELHGVIILASGGNAGRS